MSKRGENIYKRKDGRWEARYIKNRTITGKIIYGYVYAKTYSEVKQKLKDEICKTNYCEIEKKQESNIEFSVLCELWLESKKNYIKESTFAKYYNIIYAYILPYIGDILSNKINNNIIQNFICEFIDKQKENLSGKTMQDIFSVLKSILYFGIKEKYLINIEINILQPKNKKNSIKVLSSNEQIKLVHYLIKEIDYTKFGILICLSTGIRLGELCALKKKNISLENHILMVRHTLQRITNTDRNSENKTKIIIDTPKSVTSIRDIPIPKFLWEICYKILYTLPDEAYILSGQVNHFIEPRTCQNRFKKCIKECDIKDINFHALRHSFATTCIENCFDIKSLSEILGHSNVNITLNKYVHPSMELKRSYMDKLNFFNF